MQIAYSDRVNKMRPSIIRDILKMMGDPALISFGGGNPSAEAFPDDDIRRLSDRLLGEDPVGCLQYSVTEGYAPLREAARRYINRRGEVVKPSDQVMITSGSMQVMDLLAKLLCNEGDLVAVEDPTFLGAINAFRGYDVRVAGVPLEADGVDLAALERVLADADKPRLFYTIPNFQNPTGCTMSLAKRRAVYDLCLCHGVPVLEDDPYGELRISGEALPPIKSFDDEGAVIYAASMSKLLAPGLRVAFCAAQGDLIAKMTVAKQGMDVHSSLWAQRVTEAFLTGCDVEAHLEQLRGIYRRKATLMMDCLDALPAGGLTYAPPEGGMFLWLTLPDGVDMPAFVRACLDQKLALVPGSAFRVDETAPCASVRASFSTPTDPQIRAGVAIMGDVLRGMSQQ